MGGRLADPAVGFGLYPASRAGSRLGQLRSGPFEGPATEKPPALPEDVYSSFCCCGPWRCLLRRCKRLGGSHLGGLPRRGWRKARVAAASGSGVHLAESRRAPPSPRAAGDRWVARVVEGSGGVATVASSTQRPGPAPGGGCVRREPPRGARQQRQRASAESLCVSFFLVEGSENRCSRCLLSCAGELEP